MKNSKRRRIAAIAVAVALVAALMIGGTISYLSDSSDTVTNTFTPNTNRVTLTETTGSDYDIVPGTYDTKNPTVTATMTLASFIYLVVYDDSDGLVEYEIADGWVKIYDVDNEGNYTSGTVYCKYCEESGTVTYQVLEDDKVYYSAELTNEDMYDEDGELLDDLTLSFQAYIIQAEGFIISNSSGLDLATSAKNAFYYAFYNINTDDEEDINFVDDEEELTEALSDIEDGAYIILTDNVVTEDAITIAAADDVTIDLAGNTLETDSIYITNTGDDYSEGVVITSSQDGAVLSTTNSTYAIQALYADIEEISNITIDANDATYGIYVNGSNAGIDTIENVTIENATYGIYAFKVNSASNEDDAMSTISGCTIEDCTYGIWVTSSYIGLIEDCDITGTNYGIYMRASESSYTTGANVEDSTITGGKDALVMDCYGSSASVITANLTDCTLDGTNYAIEYNLYFTISLTLGNCTIGSTTGDYTLEQEASGGTGTYRQVTESNLTASTEE